MNNDTAAARTSFADPPATRPPPSQGERHVWKRPAPCRKSRSEAVVTKDQPLVSQKTGWVVRVPFLPGHFEIETGGASDYMALARFHYRAGRPATWAGVVRLRYISANVALNSGVAHSANVALSSGVAHSANVALSAGVAASRRASLAGVAVLSYPVLAFRARDRFMGWDLLPAEQRGRAVNESVRTISRVIVHPTFRGLGMSVLLIDWLVHHCHTRYVDAIAVMGQAHPLFKRAGMMEIRNDSADGPAWYVLDRAAPDAPVDSENDERVCFGNEREKPVENQNSVQEGGAKI